MSPKRATIGQIKQIILKVGAAVPIDAFSFEEAEWVLQDPSLQHDIAALLRRHATHKYVTINVPPIAHVALRALFSRVYLVTGHEERWVELGKDPDMDARVNSILEDLSRYGYAPTASVDVVEFPSGESIKDMPDMLAKMGMRPATSREGIGFLHARGDYYTNRRRSDTIHNFQVIGTDHCMMDFTTNMGPTVQQARKWEVQIVRSEIRFASNVLATVL